MGGHFSDRRAEVLVTEINCVAKGDHERVVLKTRWASTLSEKGVENCADVEWPCIGELTFLEERQMTGRVEHLDRPRAAIENPIGVIKAGFKARRADAQEWSDQGPEIKRIRWNRGGSLGKQAWKKMDKKDKYHGQKRTAEVDTQYNDSGQASCF